MENASKALIIAGGLLIAILTISLFVYMFRSVSTMQSSQIEAEELERLRRWNAEWEAYDKMLLYGTEVLTVMNKAEQNNLDYGDGEYSVTVNVYRKDKSVIKKDEILNYKTNIFKCVEINRNKSGRINEIVFEFVE